MGGSKSKAIKKHAKVAFSDSELEILEVYFELLKCHDSINGYLTQKSMVPEFTENPDFSIKLFNWMRERCKNQQIDYINFVITLELLLKEQQEYYLSDYKFRVLEKFELFALISLGCLENEKEAINRFQVSYSQGSTVIKELLNMYYFNKEVSNSQRNDLAARSVANSIFDQKASLPFNQFIGQAKQQLIYANKMCKQYFTKKFIDPQLKYGIPALTSSSFILNDQILALLQMSSPDFNRIKQLDLKFSSSVGYDDLEHITEIIIESQQPLLFIFRNREDETQNDTFQQSIFGAYISIDQTIETHFIRKQQKDPMGILYNPNDQVSLYFGDEKSFLFSLLPKYQLFMSTFDIKSKQCFGYINSRAFNLKVPQPYGLGFGGDGKGNFRIWIDENLKGSATNRINNQCDQTYEMGYLLEPHIEFLNLTSIEIWGAVFEEKETRPSNQNKFRS
ncbi:unnamed protein product (macronuclear) [Paramecium tetraurelia]|uniref:Oxidation resistance protein 1 n=1 Tax=Paramecium tetraurelia TaxID=5888 RepID=A0DN74_PARTE|nr:uncharacterized protein GSPATT00018696001 [Paramecium tetraurelia]CAK84491.1 unnamed protein product [Paramecium tetraurelia]|eukprot:XP_001451888.1 hypothetical protein (macronuclear) [Paramecium tetraurelia strain d4-2]